MLDANRAPVEQLPGGDSGINALGRPAQGRGDNTPWQSGDTVVPLRANGASFPVEIAFEADGDPHYSWVRWGPSGTTREPSRSSGFAATRLRRCLDVVWVLPDGSVGGNALNPAINDGHWNQPVRVWRGRKVRLEDRLVCVSSLTGVIEIVGVQSDGGVVVITTGGVSDESHATLVGPKGAAAPHSQPAAVSRVPDSLDVFWVRDDGAVLSNARNPAYNVGKWNYPITIAAPGAADPRSGIAAVSREPSAIDVFWIRSDGAVLSNALNPTFNDYKWNNPITIAAPGAADPRSGIAAVSREPSAIDVFWIRSDGAVLSNALNPTFNDYKWNNPITIAAPGAADPRSGIAAVSREPSAIDVFWIRSDGAVLSNALNPTFNDYKWNNPITIAAPGAADPRSGIAAVSREPSAIDVFWIRSDGAVLSNALNPTFNDYKWNNPITIAGPGSARLPA